MLRGSDIESEDCLFLNVWTEARSPVQLRPVMVWLHGGGFNYGSAAAPTYDGCFLAREREVVVVTVNHRLGALGFADPRSFRPQPERATPNAGLLDLVAALRWVRANIATFGGDPSRVMIFGQSGGGWKVSTLLATPAARGLFHRAAIQSGPGVRMTDAAYGSMIAERFLGALAESSEADAATAPLHSVLAAQAVVETALGVRLVPNLISGFAPVCDGAVLPAHPFSPLATDCAGEVPLLIGRTATEMTLFADEATLSISDQEAAHKLKVFGDEATQMMDLRRRRAPHETASSRFQHVLADITMLPFTSAIALRRYEAAQAPTYMYRVDFASPALDGRLFAPHCIELPHVFGNLEPSRPLIGGGARCQRLSEVMSVAWSSFAHDGDPSLPEGEPAWPDFAPDRQAAFVFDEQCSVDESDRSVERALAAEIIRNLFAQDATGALGRVPGTACPALEL